MEAAGADVLENDPSAHVDVDRTSMMKIPAFDPGGSLSQAIVYSTGGVAADGNGFFHPLGDHAQAGEYHQNALALYRKTSLRGEADALNGAGETLLATGRPDEAHTRHSAALSLTSQTGDRYQQARAHQGLASACQATDQLDQGRQHWQHALDIYADLGVPDATRIHASPASPTHTPAGTR